MTKSTHPHLGTVSGRKTWKKENEKGTGLALWTTAQPTKPDQEYKVVWIVISCGVALHNSTLCLARVFLQASMRVTICPILGVDSPFSLLSRTEASNRVKGSERMRPCFSLLLHLFAGLVLVSHKSALILWDNFRFQNCWWNSPGRQDIVLPNRNTAKTGFIRTESQSPHSKPEIWMCGIKSSKPTVVVWKAEMDGTVFMNI